MQEKVYSYLRFSAAKQARGASIARQTDYARKWAAAHGLTVDESLSMRDEGLSAYHQKHVKSGALGAFLETVSAGLVPFGSVLVVEGLDRLSRAEPILAQAQLAQIVNAGIRVVTAGDGKEYSRESLKANPMDLVYSLLVMIRAHEESETKSKRIADQIRRKCEGWVAGTYRGKISCGAEPSWVMWTGDRYVLNPETAPAVRRIVQMFSDGFGGKQIIARLTADGISSPATRQCGNINQLVCSFPEAFIGTRRVTASGTEFRLEGYYPALLTRNEYDRLLLSINTRRATPRNVVSKAAVTSILTGNGISSCGHCGSALSARNQRRAPKAGGRLLDRRIICPRCEAKSLRCSCSAEILENLILTYCSDQMNLDALARSDDGKRAALFQERESLTAAVTENEQKAKLLLEVAITGGEVPKVLLDRLRDLEAQGAQMKSRLNVVDVEISAAASAPAAVSAARWSEIRSGVLGLDDESRLAARHLIRDTFTKIQVFNRGALPESPGDIVDVLLVSRSGVSRYLRATRDGAFVSGLNFNKNGR